MANPVLGNADMKGVLSILYQWMGGESARIEEVLEKEDAKLRQGWCHRELES